MSTPREQAEQAAAEVEEVRLRVRAAVAELLLTWAETTHGNDFGHDHHCPVSSFRDKKGPWADDNANPERCTCGWAAFRNAYDAMQAAAIGEKR
jgi:hypothetical protein